MRVLGIAIAGLLLVTVIAEGAMLASSRKRIEALEAKVTELERAPEPASEGRGARGGWDDDGDEMRPRGRPMMPPPRFAEAVRALGAAAAAQGQGTTSDNGDPLPLPAAIDNAEAREQLRRFIAAQLEQRRQEERERFRERRERMDERMREQIATDLGLRPDERQKLDETMARGAEARTALLARLESGELNRFDLRREMTALREKTDAEVKALLGDARFGKYQELRDSGFRRALEQGAGGAGGPVGR